MNENNYKKMMEQAVPSEALIRDTKSKMKKEKPIMIKRTFSTAAALAAALVLVTATAFAAWQLMKPGDVASELGDNALSAAFESESAIHINESQTAGGYKFTLMSIVSGSDISDYGARYYGDAPSRDQTYAVLAIQKEDGSLMNLEEMMEGAYSFRIGPLVKGYKPWQVFFSRGGTATIIDGVYYALIDSDDISVFADVGVYLHVSEGFPGSGVIMFDEETGDLSLNPEFDGINLLFNLPLDKSLADPVKAQEYIERLLNENSAIDGNDDGLGGDEPGRGTDVIVERTIERSVDGDAGADRITFWTQAE